MGYDTQLDFGDEKKIKPFNWQRAFPEVFKDRRLLSNSDFKRQFDKVQTLYDESLELIKKYKVEEPITNYGQQGGFDIVIGNPPYGAAFSKMEVDYLSKAYRLQNYQLDSYFLFIEKSLSLLRKEGLLGFIIPNTWLLNLKMVKIRQYLFSNTTIESIVHYQIPVFEQAVVDTEIMIFRNFQPSHTHQINIEIYDKKKIRTDKSILQQTWIETHGQPVNIFEETQHIEIKQRISSFPLLATLCQITQGTKPFQVGKGHPPQTRKIVDNKPYVCNEKKDISFRPLLRGSLMNRYQIKWNNNYFIQFGDWLAEPRYSAHHDAYEKIIIRQTGDHLNATLDNKQFVVRDNLYTIVPKKLDVNLRYILGLLKSKFLTWYYQHIVNPEKGEALAQVKRGHLALLPIKEIDSKNQYDIELQVEIIKLVDQLLQLNEEIQTVTLESNREQLQNKIEYCENRVNKIVYQLYVLTDEEINMVESM